MGTGMLIGGIDVNDTAVREVLKLEIFSFENYVVSDCNRAAYDTCHSIASNPYGLKTNPVFIYGRSSIGKTHLAKALQNYITNNYRELKVIYATAEKYIDEIVDAYTGKTVDELKKHYESYDIIILDDFQEISGLKITKEILLEIIRSLLSNMKQVVIISEREPEKWSDLLLDGKVVEITLPDYSMCRTMIDYYSKKNGIGNVISEELVDYIFEYLDKSPHVYIAAINKITAYVRTYNCLTVEKAKNLLWDLKKTM